MSCAAISVFAELVGCGCDMSGHLDVCRADDSGSGCVLSGHLGAFGAGGDGGGAVVIRVEAGCDLVFCFFDRL